MAGRDMLCPGPRRSAARGFGVQLWEKSDRLGGTLWAAGGPRKILDAIHEGYHAIRVME